jgi:hypothetical protein
MPIDHEILRLDHNHCRAISDEVGERLREAMALKSVKTPPQLQRLIDRLDELDNVWAPGIVSSIEDAQESTILAVLEPA